MGVFRVCFGLVGRFSLRRTPVFLPLAKCILNFFWGLFLFFIYFLILDLISICFDLIAFGFGFSSTSSSKIQSYKSEKTFIAAILK